MNLSSLGPYIDFYFDPQGGFHLMGTLGFAQARISDGDDNSDDDGTASGWAAGLGLGYDFWVGDEWSLGVLGRFSFAGRSDDDIDYGAVAPSILFSFMFH